MSLPALYVILAGGVIIRESARSSKRRKCQNNCKVAAFRIAAANASVRANRQLQEARPQGGSDDQTDCSIVSLVDGGGRFRLRSTLHAQRRRRDHGPLASQLARCRGPEEDVRRHGRGGRSPG